MFSMFLLLFIFINFYVFLRGWQAIPPGFRLAYAVLYWVVAFSFFIGRLLENVFPSLLADAFTWVGSFWFAALLYLLLAVILLDALRLANHFLPFFPAAVTSDYARAKCVTALVVLGAVALTLVGGYINACTPRVRELELSVDKKAGSLKSLDIVMVSDIHLGTIIGRSRLQPLIEKINALHPDIVLMPGDMVDGDIGPVIRKNLGEELRSLRAGYGIFASTGNHEYIGGVEEACRYLNDHNITMLRDEGVKVADAFFVIGREDRSMNRRGGQRKDLKEIANTIAATSTDVDRELPVILLDHQPFDLGEAAAAGVDLQLSGHTHYGQLWPLNYVVKAIYELAWGYKRIGATHYYVSNGVGTWGPPVRVGNRPEIVRIRLNFR
ncbi:MAG: metallophosphoesterase [Acidobacteriota bacterium]|jgi:predicted MPP superfamily phosphohydrolase|nr:metallophosphoesterase [Acidobacteriota bacterium]